MKTKIYSSILLAVSLFSNGAVAQTGGTFTIEQSVIASGGGQQSAGGTFSLDSTIGQPVAGFAAAEPFTNSIGFWNFSATIFAALGFEADVAGRFDGDGLYLSNDVVQIRRFLNGTHIPNPAFNEFQRADSAPFATKGDGLLNSADVVQTRRYQNGTSPQQTAGGPITAGGNSVVVPEEVDKLKSELKPSADEPRQMRVENLMTADGQTVTVNILVNAVGDEAEYGFTLNYDAKVLSKPVIRGGNTTATVRMCNTKVAGAINCSVGGFATNNPLSSESGIGEIASGENQILITVQFTVRATAVSGETELKLSKVNAASDTPQLFTPRVSNGKGSIFGLTEATNYLQ